MLSHKKQVERARKAYGKASNAIWCLAPNGHTKFSDIPAPAELRQALNDRLHDLVTAEIDAVSAGKAWRDSLGGINFYR